MATHKRETDMQTDDQQAKRQQLDATFSQYLSSDLFDVLIELTHTLSQTDVLTDKGEAK